ncbi:AraC family transcriptional regulator [Micrococcus luteus]|jgi:effector-binding domain-containing protein|uniref:Transcriptional regulator, effector-binding domain/component n=1 Tax=Micrococcus luteus (strain ATCC 4698 / DSM 20030 / JCM 1464 / CCM 169 / CCUG 5858 / IAM 1056 / NBRC 3333 / NCIMB 9278 / NCTC 2665 / VKM Ac-2230) TaxID=465515 RepID=C5C7P4_MICLC|nr:GyrI-like domain-containing protein [Micrococcus luteus]ACS31732.1 transcriptional regulator, effector-binding domain/component [Micrococcus luteus NCTC 2665]AJO56776.1 transcriptional regulator [Micrococcus luteus]KAB1901685.1 AraC family transcriptional regulator [Micrococcus luteus NCTC 2665]ORE59793.1 AraC family transcriptional regulator [Micrococcus luteus]QCY44466.1 AraC family transcriptional regulator [Micrococcus luteus]
MSTLSEMHVIDFPGFPTVVVRGPEQSTADLPGFMDSSFRAIGQAVRQGAFAPAGPAFALYRGILGDGLGETVDLEVGHPVDVPLAGPLEVDGVRVEPSSLPTGRLAVAQHTGPYDLLPEAWGAFLDALRADGHEPGDLCWEAYDTEPGPDVDPATLVTGLAVPVRSAH